jgi:ubiquinone/menaquinone biosynthesis C-methylase UbiE
VLLDGQPPGDDHGLDISELGEGTVDEPRMYQLVRQRGGAAERTFEITFLDVGVRAYVFTFGRYEGSTVRGMVTYDEELRAHNERLRDAAGVRSGEWVLDIGCGAGLTTREAARAAAPGAVLGVDVSPAALERARELAAAESLRNVSFELGDVQTHAFEAGRFDVALSRFGTMFFSDPHAAFANVARALRPGGRLVALVWQRHGDNEWVVAIDEAIGSTAPTGADAFSLGDPEATIRLLEGAGFADVALEDVDEPVFYGPDVAAALEWVSGFRDVSEFLSSLDPEARDRAVQRLRDVLASHDRDDRGVTFDSRAWLVTARPR